MDWPVPAAAVDELYSVFGHYPRPARVDGCPCCVGADESRPFCTTSLREIPCEAIRRYAGKALTTWGTVDDYKYFLPRILELSANPEHGLELWLVASKLQYGGWDAWPDTERTAVSRFLRAGWRATLEAPPEYTEATEHLHGVAQLEAIGPYLDWWTRSESPMSLRHLGSCVQRHGNDIARSVPLWDAHRKDASNRLRRNAHEFASWLSHPMCRDALTKGFERWYGEPWSSELAAALDVLECISPTNGTAG